MRLRFRQWTDPHFGGLLLMAILNPGFVDSLQASPQIAKSTAEAPALGDLSRTERSRRASGVDREAGVYTNEGVIVVARSRFSAVDRASGGAGALPGEDDSVRLNAVSEQVPGPTLVESEVPAIFVLHSVDRIPATAATTRRTSLPVQLQVAGPSLRGDDSSDNEVGMPTRSPLLVSAGIHQTIVLSEKQRLPIVVGLRGLASVPPGESIEVEWSQLSGPDAVDFLEVRSLRTSVRFVAPGLYELRLTAKTDSDMRSSDIKLLLE